MGLPKTFVERNLKKAEGAMIFGQPLNELTKEELIACVAAGFDAEKQAREEGARRINFLTSFRA